MNSNTKTLLLCVGLPRSGKTSWIRKTNTLNHPIVETDALRLAIHGEPFIPETEPFVWLVAHYIVRALFLAGHDTVILDSTSVTRKARDKWRSGHWIRKYKIFDADADTCIERAIKDNRSDLVPIIEKMDDDWEDVCDDEWDDWRA